MVNPIIGIHAGLGELGIFSFLWFFVELLNPTHERIKRAKVVSLIGVIFLLISWFAGGFYYVNYYGPNVKPLIKEGPEPWAHSVVMELKEHVFLFIPILSILAFSMIHTHEHEIEKDVKVKRTILVLSIFIFLIGMSMAGMGYIISS